MNKEVVTRGENAVQAEEKQYRSVVATVDVVQSAQNDRILVDVELPGARKEDISIEQENNVLSVEAVAELKSQPVRYRRKLRFSENTDWDNIAASYKNGLLQINIPLKNTTRSIKVQ